MEHRSTTILNEMGDTTIAWTEDRDDLMAEIIEAKMAAGVTFFIIEDRGARRPLKDAADAMKHRALAIPDEQFSSFVEAGHGDAVKTPAKPIKKSKVAKTAKEAAKNHTVGVKQRRGG